MAFSGAYLPVSRRTYFTFFHTNSLDHAFGAGFGLGFAVADYHLDESFNFDHGAFELTEIRMHLISAHASVVDFVMQLSSETDSVYNVTFFSQPMFGVKDYRWRPDVEGGLIFFSEDTLNLSMWMSFANYYGLSIHGWSVIAHYMGQ